MKTDADIPQNNAEGAQKLRELQVAQKLTGIIGMAMKAGKITAGAELVLDAVRSPSPKKTPRRVFLSADASANTVKRVRNACTYYETPCEALYLSSAQLGGAIGKTGLVAVIGVADAGFAKAIHDRNRK